MHDSVLVQLAQALEELLDAVTGCQPVPHGATIQRRTQRHFSGLKYHVGPFVAKDLCTVGAEKDVERVDGIGAMGWAHLEHKVAVPVPPDLLARLHLQRH